MGNIKERWRIFNFRIRDFYSTDKMEKGMERKCSMHREERDVDLKTLREDIRQMGDLSVDGKLIIHGSYRIRM